MGARDVHQRDERRAYVANAGASSVGDADADVDVVVDADANSHTSADAYADGCCYAIPKAGAADVTGILVLPHAQSRSSEAH